MDKPTPPTSAAPKQGSAEWKRNERIINQNPTLRKLRDTTQGVEKSSYGSSHGGKGSAVRYGDEQAFKDNFDKIDWSRKDKPTFRVKINGKYQDEDE